MMDILLVVVAVLLGVPCAIVALLGASSYRGGSGVRGKGNIDVSRIVPRGQSGHSDVNKIVPKGKTGKTTRTMG